MATSIPDKDPRKPRSLVFLGHGDEEVVCFESRDTIPEGITLVTFTECGQPNWLPVVAAILEKMKEKPDLFKKLESDTSKATVDEIKRELGSQKMRVYTKGMKYPKLDFSPLSEFQPPGTTKKGKGYQFYFRSGVYEVPMQLPTFDDEWKVLENGRIEHPHLQYNFDPAYTFLKYGHLTAGKNIGTAKSMYTGSIFPDKDTVNTVLKVHEKGGEDIFIPIEKAFGSLGPGVYYWLVCRGDVSDKPEEVQALAKVTRRNSDLWQKLQPAITESTPKGGKRRRNRRKTYRKKRRVRKAH